jgi:phosphoglycerate kinase
MRLKKLRNDMSLKGKRVLVRIDANVPIKMGKAVDGPHGRIARSAVGINWLLQRGAKVIVMTHLGRPNGRRVSAYSVKPIAKRLSSLLGGKVKLARSIIGKDVQKQVELLGDGEVLLLENLRFDSREKDNAASFASSLAKLADLYVNDAFSVSHREHASIDAITTELPSYAGPLLSNEVSVLSKLGANSKRPFVLTLGGLKMTTKIPIIEHFASQIDAVLLGGALSTAFFVARGINVGKSVYEKEAVKSAKRIMREVKGKIFLPTDVVVVRALRKDAKQEIVPVDQIKAMHKIVDLGPDTIATYTKQIEKAKTIVWNGPLGYCEIPTFCGATRAVAKAIANRTGKATTIVGGGDTMPAIENLGLADQFTLLSTGGGALLQFLAGEKLPGVETLKL